MTHPVRRARAAALALLLAALTPAAPAFAQQPADNAPRRERPAERVPEGRRLPPDVTTRHALSLPDGRRLDVIATAGSLPLVDEAGKLQAEIAYTAYRLDRSEGGPRPVTFAVNGGPGASSAFLNLAAIGPWRLPFPGDAVSPSMATTLVPNAETWLDFTDLVFLDPVGTGYSRAAGSGEEGARRYYEVDADAATLAAAIARWLRLNDRLASPKFFVGESYGGFRGPLVAQKLQDSAGVGLSGLVLLSPVLDFAWLQGGRHTPWLPMLRLPSLAAAALERQGKPATRESLAEVEAYAAGDYLTDLLRGPRDAAALDRLTARVAALTGLDAGLVRREAGRPSAGSYQREVGRADGRVGSAYDPAVTSWNPDPTAPYARFEDPLLVAMQAPLTSAMVDHVMRTLQWRVDDLRYEVLNGSVNRQWRWGSGREAPEVVSNLRDVVALDGRLRVLVAHGASDLVTPYFASKLILDQLPAYGDAGRLALEVFPGGHMFYARDASRAAFRRAASDLYAAALRDRVGGQGTP
jgi:carboxypeptidase C (cathepsin A)